MHFIPVSEHPLKPKSQISLDIPATIPYTIHIILPTDTIQGIALKYNITVTELKKLNKIYSDNMLHIYKTVKIPVPSIRKTSSRSSIDSGICHSPTTVHQILDKVDREISRIQNEMPISIPKTPVKELPATSNIVTIKPVSEKEYETGLVCQLLVFKVGIDDLQVDLKPRKETPKPVYVWSDIQELQEFHREILLN